MTAIERLMTYRRGRLNAAEAAARDFYNALLAKPYDAVLADGYADARDDRDWWRRLHAFGMQRLYRARKP